MAKEQRVRRLNCTPLLSDLAEDAKAVDLVTFYSALILSLENIHGPERTWITRSVCAPHVTGITLTIPWNSVHSQ